MYNLVWQSVMCRPGKRSRTTIRPQDFGTRAPPRELPSFLSVTSTSGRDRTLRVLVTTAKAAAPRVSLTWQHPTRAPVCDPRGFEENAEARSSRNALKHGLSIPVNRDKTLRRQIAV